jgi:hypothetical protein
MTYTIGSYLATHLSQIGLKHHFAVAGDYFGRSRTAVPGERQQRGRRAWLKRMATANKSRRQQCQISHPLAYRARLCRAEGPDGSIHPHHRPA